MLETENPLFLSDLADKLAMKNAGGKAKGHVIVPVESWLPKIGTNRDKNSSFARDVVFQGSVSLLSSNVRMII